MKININKEYPIDAPVASAWRFLQDIPNVANCMPGAKIVEQIDDTNYNGEVRVKIGPATMSFKGKISQQKIDSDKKEITLLCNGMDKKGTSSATMDLVATVHADKDNKCKVSGVALISVSGKIVSLGGRMLDQIAEQIISQFGVNLTNNVVAMGEGEAAAVAKHNVAEQAKEINGIAFVWQMFVSFIKKIFRKQQ